MKTKRTDRGFALLSALLVLVIVVSASGVSYYVYQSQTTSNIYSKLVNNNNATKKTKPTPPAAFPLPIASKTVTDSDNGTTVTLHKNQTLIVQLSSTYWVINDATDKGVVKMVGQQVDQPTPHSYPGSGNGTATAQFSALVTGTTTITAGRTTCGEAMSCVGDQGKYQITVVVQS